MRETVLWNGGWKFSFDPSCADTLQPEALWQPVTLPHDWQIWHAKDLYRDGTGWYRKQISKKPGMRCLLYFEGVYMDAAVFVNNRLVKEWKYGYSSFEADVTDYLTEDSNELLVRCCLRHPNSRWYSGAGIYRDVWRIDCPETHLVSDSLYIVPKKQTDSLWQVTCSAEAANTLPGDSIRYTLLAPDGAAVISAVGEPDAPAVLQVISPALWKIESPACYRLQAELLRGGEAIDTLSTVCGFRTLELSPEHGLKVNGERVTLHGVCLHHDLGCLGAAFQPDAARRQLQTMKDMGVNALRTSHNMPAPGIMQLADEMGFLVDDEAFDMWERPKTQYDYARFFPEWYAADVASWVRRDRNHPSLLFWSVGNEIYDTHAGPRGREVLSQLLTEVQKHDPLKNGFTTFGSNYMAWEGTQNCAPLPDAVGYNYGEHLYDAHHEAHPDWVMYGSETASLVQSRGVYHFPYSRTLLVDDDYQCSSLGNSRTSWGAPSHQFCAASDEKYPYTLGQFLWSGTDYIGEPTPYHTKNSYFGLVDTAGFPKDDFYAYQAAWHSWQEKPVLHLLPYWDFNPGQLVDICILSNLPEVELLVNGTTMGTKKLTGGSDHHAHWQTVYAPGKIEAIGYDDRHQIIARAEEKSFGDAVRLRICADRSTLDNSGRQLVFCTVTAEDANGNPVRNAALPVQAALSGSLKLVGMDNGDSTDTDEYKTDCRRLFSGMLLIAATGSGEPGAGSITVSCPGLLSDTVQLTVTAAEADILPVLPEIPASCLTPEIPVRKIELCADGNRLTPENSQAVIHAAVFPANAAHGPLQWRITDDRGVTIGSASIEALDENTIRIKGLADGDIRVRCSCGPVLSNLEFSLSGFGSLTMNPYEPVSAALYAASHAEIGNGNERGIATAREEMSWVAYDNLDFGPAGADTLTINIFELGGNPTVIRFWKGIPYAEGSRMIGERIYHKPSIWNVYQAETFTLDEPLKGNDIFAFELQIKVHIRDFVFEPRTRAWDTIPAAAFDTVYGDSYTVTDSSVNGIGNNVSIVFRALDFGDTGCGGIAIRGRSRLEKNTIHLLFESESGQQRRIVEMAGSDDWQESVFSLEPVKGMQDVTFLFLPGCDFDFKDFRFLPAEE